NPRPEIRNPKPETRNPKPETRKPKAYAQPPCTRQLAHTPRSNAPLSLSVHLVAFRARKSASLQWLGMQRRLSHTSRIRRQLAGYGPGQLAG
ncbi:hypothetical protein T484DRAFT_1642815, partial [Baffinella frigidus]